MAWSISSRSSTVGWSFGRTARIVGWLGAIAAVVVGVSACAESLPTPVGDEAPWKTSGGVAITAAPDAGGILSFRNCPTLAEATAAMPAVMGGPEANAVPYKSMVLQCSYALPGRDAQGNPAGISILIFDAVSEGRASWVWTLGGELGSPAPVSGLGDSAYVTTHDGGRDVWVEAGRFGLHLLGPTGLESSEVLGLARAAVVGLGRPPR